MLPTPRPYQNDTDLARMLALLQAGRAAENGSYYPHTGDLKWWLFYPPLEGSIWDGIYLWDDPAAGDRLLGWALLDPSGDTFDVYCQPELHGTDLSAAMFAWAESTLISANRAAGCKQISMFWVTPEDTFRVRWLEERGYHVTAYDPALARSLDEPIPDLALPEGYEVRSCRGLAEVDARARSQHGAFGSKAPFEPYLQRFTSSMQSPAYATATDVVAAAPDGRIAAFCITWTDEINKVGLFEPVGAHPDFQRKGLGKAVIYEALRRLRDQGMRQAIVCTVHDNAPALRLYESVGFKQYSKFQWYARELELKNAPQMHTDGTQIREGIFFSSTYPSSSVFICG